MIDRLASISSTPRNGSTETIGIYRVIHQLTTKLKDLIDRVYRFVRSLFLNILSKQSDSQKSLFAPPLQPEKPLMLPKTGNVPETNANATHSSEIGNNPPKVEQNSETEVVLQFPKPETPRVGSNLLREEEGFVNLNSEKQSQIEALHSEPGDQSEPAPEGAQLGKVAVNPDSQNPMERGNNSKSQDELPLDESRHSDTKKLQDLLEQLEPSQKFLRQGELLEKVVFYTDCPESAVTLLAVNPISDDLRKDLFDKALHLKHFEITKVLAADSNAFQKQALMAIINNNPPMMNLLDNWKISEEILGFLLMNSIGNERLNVVNILMEKVMILENPENLLCIALDAANTQNNLQIINAVLLKNRQMSENFLKHLIQLIKLAVALENVEKVKVLATSDRLRNKALTNVVKGNKPQMMKALLLSGWSISENLQAEFVAIAIRNNYLSILEPLLEVRSISDELRGSLICDALNHSKLNILKALLNQNDGLEKMIFQEVVSALSTTGTISNDLYKKIMNIKIVRDALLKQRLDAAVAIPSPQKVKTILSNQEPVSENLQHYLDSLIKDAVQSDNLEMVIALAISDNLRDRAVDAMVKYKKSTMINKLKLIGWPILKKLSDQTPNPGDLPNVRSSKE